MDLIAAMEARLLDGRRAAKAAEGVIPIHDDSA